MSTSSIRTLVKYETPGLRPSQTSQSRSKSKEIKIKITDDARFRVTEIDSTLRVGEDGDITGEIENVGGEDATNAEVQFPTEAENLFPQETAVAVGDIEAGESAEFRIPIEVGSEAEAVPKRFDLPVSFRDENGIRQTDDDPSFLADIAAERDAFTIEAADRSITAGSSTTVDFTITNNRDETVTDIEPKLFADTPLSSSNDEAFVQSLDAGESTTISFDLAASATTPKTYPVTVDIRYRDAGGDSQITDSYRLPIDVSQAEEGGLLGSFGTIIVSIISLLTVGGGYVWYRNQ
jgi:NPCBM-associated, NEW3 domain of alpha-galactosidase.